MTLPLFKKGLRPTTSPEAPTLRALSIKPANHPGRIGTNSVPTNMSLESCQYVLKLKPLCQSWKSQVPQVITDHLLDPLQCLWSQQVWKWSYKHFPWKLDWLEWDGKIGVMVFNNPELTVYAHQEKFPTHNTFYRYLGIGLTELAW